MTNITVLDSIMGSGKSTYVINMLNEAWVMDQAKRFTIDDDSYQPPRFILVVPLLSEVSRFQKACPQHDFRDPEPQHGSKLYHLDRLVDEGANIVTTHSLFRMLNRTIYEKLLKQNYTLIIDEVLDCVEMFEGLSRSDRTMLMDQRMVYVDDQTRRLCWNHADHPDYKGQFQHIQFLCDTGSLVYVSDKVLLWEFPSEFLKCFTEVIVCTYLFKGSPFCAYLMSEGFTITMKAVRDGRLMDWNEGVHDQEVKRRLGPLIHVYGGSMNKIGNQSPKSHPLSATWTEKMAEETARHLKSSVVSYFERHANTPSHFNAWTCFSSGRSKLQGKGYTKGFIPCNAKATNDYAHKQSLAYLCNQFYNPVIKQYFTSKRISVDEDVYALSAMIQWIWRSRIRKGQSINLFIPSERMRKLLKGWLADELPKISIGASLSLAA